MRKFMMFFSIFTLLLLTACGNSASKDSISVIKLADAGWDSMRVHNSIAQIILEEGYGYDTEIVNGTSTAVFQALQQGDIQVMTEVWSENLGEAYTKAIDNGDIVDVATNFDDNAQGLYVPTYVIKGDTERGIEATAPDLKTVKDLEKYPELFKDPEDPKKGRIIGAPSSWVVSKHLEEKIKTYGLDKTFTYLAPGSDSSIVADLASAYKKGEPWVGYYWSPTWVTASYDLTLLEDEPFDEAVWEENKGTEFPPNDVVVAVHKDLETQAPEVVEFFKHYETSNDLTEEALNYMGEHEANPADTAKWFMKEHEDLWTSWVPEDIAEKVKAAL
ncbi:ABC transporter substrate-binding protein [Sporosarcina sp. P37]|uniref:ABC transporter substrate-binding protein n=1 Tax=unclassified Sporosarcina TaxID=2647733 RepID=UPI0009BD0C11|nr:MULTISPECIES: ABC transporter substrate-binding protein [unclassified Sporosarcina]ARD47352.1 ABC transporter substrate-binding protein [Sporosarcina sp. P33]ARK23918.1 ABC transporter substrate-binding protein [Sporosarcina sp. P37]PID17712.1 ABC transporter substrate-binding protein [Sporosarcina sp. P35]